MFSAKRTSQYTAVLLLLVAAVVCVRAQAPNSAAPNQAESGISLAPARLELEMPPGSETTLVVNLDYHTTKENSQPVRILASINDWTIDRNGQVQFARANSFPNSASSWLLYSPAETTVVPGNVHPI